MITVYKVDSRRVFTGEVIEKGSKDVIKRDEIMVAPPEGEGFHIWDGHKWFTRQEYPHPVVTPERKTEFTVLEFRNLFTAEEKVAIYTAADQSIMVKIWLDDLNAATSVSLLDAATVTGLTQLNELGLISDERLNEFLGDVVVPQEDDL